MSSFWRVFAAGLVGVSSIAISGSVLPDGFSGGQPDIFTASPDTSIVSQDGVLVAGFVPSTQSLFAQKEVAVEEELGFPTTFTKDPELEQGLERVVQEGHSGQLIKTFLVEEYQEKEYRRILLKTQRIEPQPKIIAQGTRVVARQMETPDGPIKYTRQLKVFATAYDGNCPGCRGVTATGTKVEHGVCAVDPRVIPLGSWFYVPGYGKCRAEDIGGSIKGKRVDLGFEDVRQGIWSARSTDLFILSQN